MLLALLPREDESGICRVIGLDAVRESGGLRVGLLLCDGGSPAGEYPARFFDADNVETALTVRLPELADASYEGILLEVLDAE